MIILEPIVCPHVTRGWGPHHPWHDLCGPDPATGHQTRGRTSR